MGCGESSQSEVATPAAPSAPPPAAAVLLGPGQNASKSKGKGRGKGKGKGKGKGVNFKDKKFQIELSGQWKDYEPQEDGILKQSFLVGQPNCRFNLRGQHYEYNFREMLQKNLGSGKTRKIRPPPGMRAPKDPLLPTGPMMVVKVPQGGANSMTVNDPNNPGSQITVAIPPRATAGSRIAVPLPEQGQSVEEVVKKQQGWKTGTKVAAGAAAVGALAVGGVVLGEHLSGGAVSGFAADHGMADAGGWVADAAEWSAGAAGDAGDWAAGAAGDAGDWAAGAAGDAGDWAAGAAGDAGDWAGGAAGDVGDWAGAAGDWGAEAADWLGDVGDDAADFIINLF